MHECVSSRHKGLSCITCFSLHFNLFFTFAPASQMQAIKLQRISILRLAEQLLRTISFGIRLSVCNLRLCGSDTFGSHASGVVTWYYQSYQRQNVNS